MVSMDTLEGGIDSTKKNIIWVENLEKHLPERRAFVPTICNSNDATQFHFRKCIDGLQI